MWDSNTILRWFIIVCIFIIAVSHSKYLKKINKQQQQQKCHNLNPTINISILAEKTVTFYFKVM